MLPATLDTVQMDVRTKMIIGHHPPPLPNIGATAAHTLITLIPPLPRPRVSCFNSIQTQQGCPRP